MEQNYSARKIGCLHIGEGSYHAALDPPYRPALTGLDGYEYLHVLWWFSGCDNAVSRGNLVETHPYTKGPQRLGVFATRSPERPNPIALSCVRVRSFNPDSGILEFDYIDADDQSPILDIKPYTPCLDRVHQPGVPDWCSHWPHSVETCGSFDWASEMNP